MWDGLSTSSIQSGPAARNLTPDSCTNARLGLHVVVLILRDDAYGMIKWKQASMGLKNFGLEYGNPDFVKYADSYGAVGHRVTSIDTLRSTLQTAHEAPGVHVVEVPVDYADNDRILNREIQERSALV